MVQLPSTKWRPTSGIGEAGQSDSASITAQNDNILITQDNMTLIVEKASYTPLPATDWVESEGQ